MKNTSISPACFGHVEAIGRMVNAECRDLWPSLCDRIVDAHVRLSQLALRCHHRQLFVMAGHQGVQGAVLADKLYFRGPEITFLIVAPTARRLGCGIALVRAACQWLGAYPGVTFFVPRECPALAGLADKSGFRPAGRLHTRLGVHGRLFLIPPAGVQRLAVEANQTPPAATANPTFVNPIGGTA